MCARKQETKVEAKINSKTNKEIQIKTKKLGKKPKLLSSDFICYVSFHMINNNKVYIIQYLCGNSLQPTKQYLLYSVKTRPSPSQCLQWTGITSPLNDYSEVFASNEQIILLIIKIIIFHFVSGLFSQMNSHVKFKQKQKFSDCHNHGVEHRNETAFAGEEELPYFWFSQPYKATIQNLGCPPQLNGENLLMKTSHMLLEDTEKAR